MVIKTPDGSVGDLAQTLTNCKTSMAWLAVSPLSTRSEPYLLRNGDCPMPLRAAELIQLPLQLHDGLRNGYGTLIVQSHPTSADD